MLVIPQDVDKYLTWLWGTKKDRRMPLHALRGEQDCASICSLFTEFFEPTSLLSIGCGLATAEAFIANRVETMITVHLMDGAGDAIGPRYNGFRDGLHPWHDVKHGVAMVQANTNCEVIGYGPDPSLTIPADLIMSIQSWGFHYPISEYLGLVDRSLPSGGMVITDIRNETGGAEALVGIGLEVVGETDLGKSKRTAFVRR